MSKYKINELPREVSDYQAVEQVYSEQFFLVRKHLIQKRSLILQTPKHMYTYITRILRKELNSQGLDVVIIDGRQNDNTPGTRLQRMVRQFEESVMSYNQDTVFLLPYFDVLTSSSSSRQGSRSAEAAEIFTLIHENPSINMVAFEDPEYMVPEIIGQAFFTRISFLGTPRNKLPLIITQNEASRFGFSTLPLLAIHRLLAGQSPIQIRRIMAYISELPQVGNNTPEILEENLRAVRELTLAGEQILSPVDMETDIAGYKGVKEIIRNEIIDLYKKSQEMDDEQEAAEIEALIPRGIILFGPPGTGKTLFAQGIANAIEGPVFLVNGPELKSMWVGEGESNIRRLFARAREHSPSVIVFDEIDSLAAKRSGGDSFAESSRTMVNQLLTEMDGFRPDEMVFVVGTTNLPDLLDPALLRPGRFQLKIEVPYPDSNDREAILAVWSKKYSLNLSADILSRLAQWTSRPTGENTPYTGDHLRSLCQGLKRWMIRTDQKNGQWDKIQKWLKETYMPERETDKEAVTFSQVAGYARLKERMEKEILTPLRLIKNTDNWEEISSYEEIIPRGILLAGPPGTGKTHLAAAVAGEWGARLELVSGPEILSKWVGQSESNLRDLFSRAKSNPPTVIVLDELDALARDRSQGEQSGGGRTVLLQLMTELSELTPRDRILVIATTNRAEDIDPALLRPGRLGSPWYIDYPDAEDITELVHYYMNRYKLELKPEILDYLEALFQGPSPNDTPYSADHIRALFQQIKRQSLIDNNAFLDDIGVFSQWLQKIQGGQTYTPVQMRRVAIHEAGHALMLILTDRLEQVEEIRLTTGGSSLGYVKHRKENAPFLTENDMKNDIAVSLAGRGAELLCFSDRSSGCMQDLENATQIAQMMIGRLGMGPDPQPQCFGSSELIDPVFLSALQPRISQLIQEQSERVDKLLKQHQPLLEELGDLLLDRKRITRKALQEWWNEKSSEEENGL